MAFALIDPGLAQVRELRLPVLRLIKRDRRVRSTSSMKCTTRPSGMVSACTAGPIGSKAVCKSARVETGTVGAGSAAKAGGPESARTAVAASMDRIDRIALSLMVLSHSRIGEPGDLTASAIGLTEAG
jgi:hypothetical protein